MIDMRYKPSFLPQISMPYDLVLDKLDDDDIKYELIEIDPNDLNPLQGITFSDEISNINLDDSKPIWISDELNVIDGHHRYVLALQNNLKLKAVKIYMNHKDSCRLLNKIQDIYEYEKAQNLEEFEGINEIGAQQNNINTENEIDSDLSRSDKTHTFLSMLEEENSEEESENEIKNSKNLVGYRKDPINENSVIGNFFLVKPIQGFDKYEIDFENLLDTNELGLTYKKDHEPVDILAKIWFPNINFEKLGESYDTEPINLKNKAITEKAINMGYDGIKYGDTLIQGLK